MNADAKFFKAKSLNEKPTKERHGEAFIQSPMAWLAWLAWLAWPPLASGNELQMKPASK